jgi:hypothetical protein
MPSIKFNQLTKEIEVKGSESFIASNFNRIQDLLVENFGVKKMIVSRETKANQEPQSFMKMKELQANAELKRHERSEASPMPSTTKSGCSELSQEPMVKRQPLRKYIRKEGMPGQQRIVVEVAEQKPREITIASLKEKFGLSESKIGGIIRDGEKLGKIRRVMNGSYVWAQD